jgi:hypothetical protein
MNTTPPLTGTHLRTYQRIFQHPISHNLGRSSEMEQFIGWAKTHHPELAGRMIGSLTVDEHHLTPDQLLAKAREFYVNVGISGSVDDK